MKYKQYGKNKIGKNCLIMDDVVIGYPSNDILEECKKLNISISEHEFTDVKIRDNITYLMNLR